MKYRGHTPSCRHTPPRVYGRAQAVQSLSATHSLTTLGWDGKGSPGTATKLGWGAGLAEEDEEQELSWSNRHLQRT